MKLLFRQASLYRIYLSKFAFFGRAIGNSVERVLLHSVFLRVSINERAHCYEDNGDWQ